MRESILSELRDFLLTRGSLSALPEPVWRRSAALNTWGTNAIEGNALTWHDVERVLLQGLSVGNRPMRDVLETIQHEAAFRGLLDRLGSPVTLLTVLELHEAVFRGVLSDAGQWRRVGVRIVGSDHVPPRPERVIGAMAEWEESYGERDLAGEPVFPLGAWMHHELESNHPFTDGNGRVGRLLLNLHFLRHNWPPVHVLPPDREVYLRCMERGHAGDLSLLEEFLQVAMARSLLDLLDQVGTQEDVLHPLKEFEPEGLHSSKYLALRASQGELPAVKVSGRWHTSQRALRLYQEQVGRA